MANMMLKPDKALLEDLIAQAENLNEADYEAQSFAVMRTALAAAKDVFENEAATQEEIDASAAELKDAIAKLTAADSGEDQQGGNTGSTDQTGGAVSSTEPPTLVSSGQNSVQEIRQPERHLLHRIPVLQLKRRRQEIHPMYFRWQRRQRQLCLRQEQL